MIRPVATLILSGLAGLSLSQSLHWKPVKEHQPWTALYGQITVLASKPDTCFCGVDWWASHPAAGMTGIQNDSGEHKKIVFSVWPTDKLDGAFPKVGQTNPKAGTVYAKDDVHGAHCELDYGWQAGHTYQFYLTKRPDANGRNIVVSLYFYDEAMDQWVGEGRIVSPIDGKQQVPNFDGGLTSSLTDLLGQKDPDKEAPRLALFRLWGGTSPGDLQMITEASGVGTWGVMNGAFYLALGDDLAIVREMQSHLGPNGHVELGKKKAKLEIPAERVAPNIVQALEQLR